MVYSRNLVVVSLLSVLVGALAGIGTMQYAQVMAYGGVDPNAAKNLTIKKQVRTCINPRSIVQNLFWGTSKERPCPVVKSAETDPVLHGAPTVVEPVSDDCAQTGNARRRAACNSGEDLTNETNR
ncbi:MAG TPA: hypothetical protein DEB30_00750 [Candidatus Peribacter riflensis]|uniref:Uncharacterized protein n=1 Tax=Candidatus Peribacter riflensis TaxID=1735162 RepID=A0A0S1SUJ5_9BACT|nr:MAG: hypothetical protein PeribacterA2_0274 [Candidatus Peribacter riflensis]OGJ82996.1 MAG: hypothetical protein A2412_05245 [Candidatus Peribacteria bacterium RIFOXYC1_FULL_58_8]ALM10768.1 MAG: hypothetical protein PeribacterB2_0274 [Candidatus Peribacter riflensis]ALM11870.1 MAG: hypothetical protein PeribacterC2_0273 [Candidatus Peribacter riflensis]ALM12973.1 MAG: hypothetical protein PeribacterD1_0274 [Candidatus Peribacter riflensis]